MCVKEGGVGWSVGGWEWWWWWWLVAGAVGGRVCVGVRKNNVGEWTERVSAACLPPQSLTGKERDIVAPACAAAHPRPRARRRCAHQQHHHPAGVEKGAKACWDGDDVGGKVPSPAPEAHRRHGERRGACPPARGDAHPRPLPAPRPSPPPSLGPAARRRPLLIALAGLIIIIGSLQALKAFRGGDQQAAAVVETLPEQVAPQTAPVLPAPVPAEPPEAPQRDSALSPKSVMGTPGPLASSGFPAPLPGSFDRTPVSSVPTTPPATSNVAVLPRGNGLIDLANAGNASAQYELAARYADGRGMTRDSHIAQQWFEKAALQGLAPAQYRLGSMYERGAGIDKDLKRARDWYVKAAAQGNVRAMHNLAVLNAEGVDGKPDYPAAASWFRKAAEYGVRDSQYNLAILYARGLGIEQNLQLSWAWFNAAAQQGDDDASKKRDDVAARMDAGQIAAAKALVDVVKPRTADPGANEVAPPVGGWDAGNRGDQARDAKPPAPGARSMIKGKVTSL